MENVVSAMKTNDKWIAAFEAGHLIIARLVGREIDKVSLEIVDGKRGCFYRPINEAAWDDWKEHLCLLAGPKAQIEVCPESILEEKLAVFREKIIQDTENRYQIPAIYNCTGWQHDILPVYEYLCMPDAPVDWQNFGLSRRQLITNVEKSLTSFFAEIVVKAAVVDIAKNLSKVRTLSGGEATEFVQAAGLFEIPAVMNFLTRP